LGAFSYLYNSQKSLINAAEVPFQGRTCRFTALEHNAFRICLAGKAFGYSLYLAMRWIRSHVDHDQAIHQHDLLLSSHARFAQVCCGGEQGKIQLTIGYEKPQIRKRIIIGHLS
jgi:hypothetical protein